MIAGGAPKTSAYDRVSTMFSPKGRLYQVEYAAKIVEQGTLGVGIIYDTGVLFAAEKNITSPLLLPESIEKLFKIDDHIGAISAGLVGDARRLIKIARERAQENQMYYEEKIEVETLVKELSAIKQYFTQYAGMRPFGVSFIIGGYDGINEKKLFETEPSGALAQYKATAIGKNKAKAMEVLEKGYNEKMSLEQAAKLAFEALKQSREKKEPISLNSLDFALIEDGKEFERLSQKKLKSLLGK
ncbi:MAG: archaeal proteasome endopeptidase complex subunit alpha [Candidatus Diapherotrites archaeon]